MSKGSRGSRPSASDLLVTGRWLPPNAAADAMGISLRQLVIRVRRREVARRELSPGVFLYEVA